MNVLKLWTKLKVKWVKVAEEKTLAEITENLKKKYKNKVNEKDEFSINADHNWEK